tara:strand:- start:7575 stop:7736 length:162 start_codon:yes stop_codon:yes gene_type:complete
LVYLLINILKIALIEWIKELFSFEVAPKLTHLGEKDFEWNAYSTDLSSESRFC